MNDLPSDVKTAPLASGLSTFVIAPFQPRRIADRSLRWPWFDALVLHVLAAIGVFVAVLILVGLVEARGLSVTLILDAIRDTVGDLLLDIERAMANGPWLFAGMAILVAVLVEAAVIGFAALLAPWGARDEPLRTSLSFAIRRTWIQSAQLPLLVLIAGLLPVFMQRAHDAYFKPAVTFSSSPPRPPDQPPPSADQAAQDAFDRAMSRYQKDLAAWQEANWGRWSELRSSRPWYIEYQAPICALWIVGAIALALTNHVRSMGAAREAPLIERPPRCETCGYNLTLLAMDGRCPECGASVESSIGPGRRIGNHAHPTQAGANRGYRRRLVRANLRDPYALGRRLPIVDETRSHARSFLRGLIPVAIIGALAPPVLYCTERGRIELPRDYPEFMVFSPMLAVFACVVAFGVAGLAAWIAALWHQKTAERNLLPASIQVAGHLAGYFTVSAVFMLLSGATALSLTQHADLFRQLCQSAQIDHEVIAVLGWLAANFAMLVYYVLLVCRGTAGLRFANP